MPSAEQGQAMYLPKLKKDQDVRYAENLFLYSAAPVLRGVKPSVLFRVAGTYSSAFRERQEFLCRLSQLQIMELGKSPKSVLTLIYDEAEMARALRDPLAVRILSEYGYMAETNEVVSMLDHLRTRLLLQKFPHEIGLFLGYPSEDVRDFIANSGKNCLLCRYWKVYHNIERAQETFDRIDEAKRYALHLLRRPLPVHTAVRMLQAM